MPIRLGGRKTLKRLESFLTLWAGGKILLPAPPHKADRRISECFYRASPDTGDDQPRIQPQQTATYKLCGGEPARPRITHSATNNKPQIYRFKLIFLAYLL